MDHWFSRGSGVSLDPDSQPRRIQVAKTREFRTRPPNVRFAVFRQLEVEHATNPSVILDDFPKQVGRHVASIRR